jgi:hypothetical protein
VRQNRDRLRRAGGAHIATIGSAGCMNGVRPQLRGRRGVPPHGEGQPSSAPPAPRRRAALPLTRTAPTPKLASTTSPANLDCLCRTARPGPPRPVSGHPPRSSKGFMQPNLPPERRSREGHEVFHGARRSFTPGTATGAIAARSGVARVATRHGRAATGGGSTPQWPPAGGNGDFLAALFLEGAGSCRLERRKNGPAESFAPTPT